MGGPLMPGALKSPELERIAQAATKTLTSDGKAAASAYIYGALEQAGLYDMAHPARSKLKAWEVWAIADRSLEIASTSR